MIGQDVPTLLPALLTDLLFAGDEANAEVTVEEGNPAMQELLQGYGEKIFAKAGKGGTFQVFSEREKVLDGADCVIYAGDCQAASRFFQDRSALDSDEEEDPGLTDQARVNGGIEGLLHALRAGEVILKLCDDMDKYCPKALVINLGQPVARTTAVFEDRGYRCYGMGRTPMRGANGIDTYAKRLQIRPENVQAVTAGLPGFAFLIEMKDGKTDLLTKLKKAADNGELGSLARRWLGWWDAIPAGDVTDHAEFLPAQEGFIPDERPEFGETVEKRKERILYMNTVRDQGADSREGAMAQLLLLSKVPPVRPMKLALALLRGETAEIPAVARKNGGTMPQLSPEAIIETALVLKDGKQETPAIRVPEALADILCEVDNANRLAAKAAFGDREALREYVETDPALDGLDRLYCRDVVDALIEMHKDVLTRF
ncbi:Alpha-galactosidase/6-phospho-beta-glucosidase, family 4 of glycosyl hydrolase [Aristaeella hokkaidonensis]|nr:Alpha-galactosidase/6-phospho-beta-glucosidase, family 4 of glycosyl hydrolase [Aristaeella hokkaidonensis]